MSKKHQRVASGTKTRTGQARKGRHKEARFLEGVAREMNGIVRINNRPTTIQPHTNGHLGTVPEFKSPKADVVTITPPKFKMVKATIIGETPYMQARFSGKAMQAMKSKMEQGQAAKKGGKRDPRNFDDDFKNAQHIAKEGWVGIPAAAFRNALIDVCRMVGFKMTFAKMSIFVLSDGTDAIDGIPLVRLIAGKPEKNLMAVRNATGVADLRVRPMWREWKADLTIRYDEDQFSRTDVINLLARAGQQVGLGEGRAFSRESNGLGLGQFRVESKD